MTCCRGSKLALLHRVKERQTPSLSAQASFAPFSLKVARSGKSLIVAGSALILELILSLNATKQVHSSHPYQRPIHQQGDQRGVNHPSGYGAVQIFIKLKNVYHLHINCCPKMLIRMLFYSIIYLYSLFHL